jgi:hypothetical protein
MRKIVIVIVIVIVIENDLNPMVSSHSVLNYGFALELLCNWWFVCFDVDVWACMYACLCCLFQLPIHAGTLLDSYHWLLYRIIMVFIMIVTFLLPHITTQHIYTYTLYANMMNLTFLKYS